MTVGSPLFILGAGFGNDVKAIVGDDSHRGYPLVSELGDICFDGKQPQKDGSIEAQFQEALESGNNQPMKLLSDRLMECDYLLASELQQRENCYLDFLKKFSGSSFLTFNYDSLVEILLHGLERWFPADGFGVPVKVNYAWFKKDWVAPSSKQLVVHLHGTLYVSTQETNVVRYPGNTDAMVELLDCPLFHFDPDSMQHRFPNFAQSSGFGDDDLPHERVIAPIPDKASGRTQEFIKLVNQRAEQLIAKTELVIAIGYGFNEHDRSSYDRLIRTLNHVANPKMVVIAPDSQDICQRLRKNYTEVVWIPVTKTFREWVDDGFKY
ncbi:MAG: hypothetical protein D4R48_01010 [Nitrosomonadales bacterium]|nr:MAG: hypothetical protein D4R48_01010 [Nitrosomonadales bacterium]